VENEVEDRRKVGGEEVVGGGEVLVVERREKGEREMRNGQGEKVGGGEQWKAVGSVVVWGAGREWGEVSGWT